MERLEKTIKYLWMAKLGFIGLITGFLIGAGVFAFTENVWISTVFILLLPILNIWYASLRYQNWGFELRDDHVYIRRGVLVKIFSMVPHVRIQHIDTSRTPLERVFGLTSLKIFTAGSRGADVRIPGLKKERAKELQEHLRDVAIESERGFDGV